MVSVSAIGFSIELSHIEAEGEEESDQRDYALRVTVRSPLWPNLELQSTARVGLLCGHT